jgi:GTP-binding protein Era
MPPRKKETPAKRCAVIGVVGRTNVGKSTLVNQLVGEKISIVSPVVQTTRNTIRGVLTEPRGQLVFVDTPGLHKSESQLGTLMNRMARHAAANVDALLVVFDGSCEPQIEDDGWMRRALFAEQPCVFFLNKSDMTPSCAPAYRELWDKVQQEKGKTREVPCLRGSAESGDGLRELVQALFGFTSPTEQLLYDPETLTDYPRKLAIADVIREKLFAKIYEEVPHEVGVRVDAIEEHDKQWHVTVTIFVNRASQKGFVLGPKGRTLRYVRRLAEPELSGMFGVEVELQIWVKVEKNWMKNFWLLREMGYAGEM